MQGNKESMFSSSFSFPYCSHATYHVSCGVTWSGIYTSKGLMSLFLYPSPIIYNIIIVNTLKIFSVSSTSCFLSSLSFLSICLVFLSFLFTSSLLKTEDVLKIPPFFSPFHRRVSPLFEY